MSELIFDFSPFLAFFLRDLVFEDFVDEAMDAVAGNRAEIDQTLADLRDTMSNLKAFSQQVNERPYMLIRKTNPADRKPGDGVGE